MSTPLSIRFQPEILDRLREVARQRPGATASGLVQQLVDEGLRQLEHPGIVFKDGPTGRRAALAFGPDVWEVVAALEGLDERGQAGMAVLADDLELSVVAVRRAVRYYGQHHAEIDEEVAHNRRAAEQGEREWLVAQRLLA